MAKEETEAGKGKSKQEEGKKEGKGGKEGKEGKVQKKQDEKKKSLRWGRMMGSRGSLRHGLIKHSPLRLAPEAGNHLQCLHRQYGRGLGD